MDVIKLSIILVFAGILLGLIAVITLPPMPPEIVGFGDWLIQMVRESAQFGRFIYSDGLWVAVLTISIAIIAFDTFWWLGMWIYRNLKGA